MTGGHRTSAEVSDVELLTALSVMAHVDGKQYFDARELADRIDVSPHVAGNLLGGRDLPVEKWSHNGRSTTWRYTEDLSIDLDAVLYRVPDHVDLDDLPRAIDECETIVEVSKEMRMTYEATRAVISRLGLSPLLRDTYQIVEELKLEHQQGEQAVAGGDVRE